jgi:hypothetical protein
MCRPFCRDCLAERSAVDCVSCCVPIGRETRGRSVQSSESLRNITMVKDFWSPFTSVPYPLSLAIPSFSGQMLELNKYSKGN